MQRPKKELAFDENMIKVCSKSCFVRQLMPAKLILIGVKSFSVMDLAGVEIYEMLYSGKKSTRCTKGTLEQLR